MNCKLSSNRYKCLASFITNCGFLAIFLFLCLFAKFPSNAQISSEFEVEDNSDIHHYRPEDEICKYLLNQLANSIFGPRKIYIFEDVANFKRFIDNFKYDPKRLIREIPLTFTESIDQYVVQIIESLKVDMDAFILTEQKEIFVPVKTIRGLYFLCISKKPLVEAEFEYLMKDYNFCLLETRPFLKNLLMNENWLDAALESREFLNYLIPEHDSTFGNIFDSSLFFIDTVTKSYDISGVTGESRYFLSDLSKRRNFSFFGLPIFEFDNVDLTKPRHPFFKMTDPNLLNRCLKLMSKNSMNLEENFFFNSIQTFIKSQTSSQFSVTGFKDQFQAFLIQNNFTINFDVLASDWELELYENLKVFLYSNGVHSFESLLQRPDFLNIIIERFFVLGTTYFYRSWTSLEDWTQWAREWKERNGNNPEKPFKALFCAASTGEEVLSFAFTLLDMGIENFYILGSDINQEFVRRAMEMTYSKESFERLSMKIRKNILKKYFIKIDDNRYRVKDYIFNERILYRVWDITRPLPPLPDLFQPPYDLISCQNVLLYLNPKSAFDTYRNLMDMQTDRGLFILVDKNISHLSQLKTNARNYLFINEYLLEKYPNVPKETVYELARDSEEFATASQWINLEINNDKKWEFLSSIVEKPGNHVLIYFHMINLLIENQKYKMAYDLIVDSIKKYPLLQNLYKQAHHVSVQLRDDVSVQYFKLLDETTSKMHKIMQSDGVDFREVRKLFIKLLNLKPDDGLGHVVYGSHLVQYALHLQDQGLPLIDYEKYLSEAFRSFLFTKQFEGFKEIAFTGMNEIALVLSKIHISLNNHDLAARILYNAFFQSDDHKVKFKDFKGLFTLAEIDLKLGELFVMAENFKNVDLLFTSSLQLFQEASRFLKNHKPRMIYEYYVQYANLWYLLSVYLGKNKNSTLKYSQGHCSDMAMKYIDLALEYNSVYGIEAIQVRDALFRTNPDMLKKYNESYE